MKRILIIAIALSTLASCNKDEAPAPAAVAPVPAAAVAAMNTVVTEARSSGDFEIDLNYTSPSSSWFLYKTDYIITIVDLEKGESIRFTHDDNGGSTSLGRKFYNSTSDELHVIVKLVRTMKFDESGEALVNNWTYNTHIHKGQKLVLNSSGLIIE